MSDVVTLSASVETETYAWPASYFAAACVRFPRGKAAVKNPEAYVHISTGAWAALCDPDGVPLYIYWQTNGIRWQRGRLKADCPECLRLAARKGKVKRG